MMKYRRKVSVRKIMIKILHFIIMSVKGKSKRVLSNLKEIWFSNLLDHLAIYLVPSWRVSTQSRRKTHIYRSLWLIIRYPDVFRPPFERICPALVVISNNIQYTVFSSMFEVMWEFLVSADLPWVSLSHVEPDV